MLSEVCLIVGYVWYDGFFSFSFLSYAWKLLLLFLCGRIGAFVPFVPGSVCWEIALG